MKIFIICSMTLLLFLFFTLQSLRAEIIDTHVHLVSAENVLEVAKGSVVKNPRAILGDLALKSMDANGISKAFLIPFTYRLEDRGRAQSENDFILKQKQLAPDRFYAFGSAPLTMDWALEEITRCMDELKLDGLKLYFPGSGFDVKLEKNQKKLAEIFGFMEKAGKPVLMHIDSMDPVAVEILFRMVRRDSKTNFILAHALEINFRYLELAAMFYSNWPQLKQNLYVDISGTLQFYKDSHRQAEFLGTLRLFGIENVLFATDFPFFQGN